jgi:hypothetical protein
VGDTLHTRSLEQRHTGGLGGGAGDGPLFGFLLRTMAYAHQTGRSQQAWMNLPTQPTQRAGDGGWRTGARDPRRELSRTRWCEPSALVQALVCTVSTCAGTCMHCQHLYKHLFALSALVQALVFTVSTCACTCLHRQHLCRHVFAPSALVQALVCTFSTCVSTCLHCQHLCRHVFALDDS